MDILLNYMSLNLLTDAMILCGLIQILTPSFVSEEYFLQVI